jgi:hypothetical protein
MAEDAHPSEKGASKFATNRKIPHLREAAAHHSRYSAHNCKCVADSRAPLCPFGGGKE